VPFSVPFTDPTLASLKAGQLTGRAGAVPGAAAGVVSAIRDASARSGMPFNVMLASAQMESGLDPKAQAGTSSATGLFQFIDQTWLDAVRQYGPQHGLSADAASIVRRDGRLTVDDPAARQRILDLRKDPAVASMMAGDHLRAISDKLAVTVGRAPDATEIYLGHLLGSGGAAQLLQAVRTSPNQSASALLPAAAGANPTLFNAPDGTPYSVTQFMQHLGERVGRAYASVGAVMPRGPVNLGAPGNAATASLGMGNPGTAGVGLHRLPSGADADGSGASGWGTNASRKIRQPVERQVMATMTEVFTRLDRSNRSDRGAARRTQSHGKSQHGLPAGLLTALQSESGATSS
jgi:hypothetical protein